MKNVFAINTNTYHGFSTEEALEGIAAAGFKYIEICAVRNWSEHIMPEWSAERKAAVVNRIKELGLTCIALGGHCDLTDAERLKDFRANMELAHELGCEWIISSTGEAHFGKGEGGTEDTLIKNIKGLVPDLERLNLKLGIEVHGANYGTGEAVARLVRGVDSPRVGVNYDTANVVFYGGRNPIDDIKTCVDKLNYCHLKDKVGMDNSWNFPAIGSGELDLIGVMDYMKQNGYEGPFSIEIEHNEGFTMREKVPGDLDFVNKVVKDSFDYLHANGLI